jgi:uncharacterized protein with HEPN domain
MLEAILRVRRYLGRRSRAAFLRSALIQDAVMRNIELIGEAAARISADFAAKHSRIPWRDIVGMRHRLIHGYAKVKLDLVWDAAVRDLPALEKELRALLRARKPAVRKKRRA